MKLGSTKSKSDNWDDYKTDQDFIENCYKAIKTLHKEKTDGENFD